MAAAKPGNVSLLLLGSFNSTPGAEVPQMSQSLFPGKRNLCWSESLGEEREEPLAQGEHSSLAVGKELPQEPLCTMREEKATQSHDREQPCLHCSHLPRQSCCAGGNLSFSPGLLFGRIRARGSPSLLPASLLHSSFCSQSHPAVTSVSHTPNTAPNFVKAERLKALWSGPVQGQGTCHSWISPLFKKIHHPKECPSSITPKAQEN